MAEKNVVENFKTHWQYNYFARIETSTAGYGIPDTHIRSNDKDMFVEFKYMAKKFKRKKLNVRLSQVHWHLKYKFHNGKSYFLFKVADRYYIIRGGLAKIFLEAVNWEMFEDMASLISPRMQDVVKFFKDECR